VPHGFLDESLHLHHKFFNKVSGAAALFSLLELAYYQIVSNPTGFMSEYDL
jgi:hypothetical protein